MLTHRNALGCDFRQYFPISPAFSIITLGYHVAPGYTIVHYVSVVISIVILMISMILYN